MAHSKSPQGLHQFVQAWLKDQPGISKKQRDELAKRGAAELKALAEELMQEAERREKEPKVTNTP
jgi:hypothetical protein